MATTYYNDLQKLYVAYFNRPGDAGGLANYEAQLEAAGTDAKAIAAVMARISAEFSNSTEYKANFTGKTNAEIVDIIYQNLFGRAADEGGKKFYADNLTAGKVTIAAVVTEVAKGAQGSDLVAYNNKVTAATAFSAALKSTDSYNTQAAATAAKAFLSGVTDNASLALAVDPIALQVAIAKVNAAAQPFSLQTGLDALNAANAIKTTFLDGADGKVDGKFGSSTGTAAQAETKIGTDVTTKTGDVAAIVEANATTKGVYATTTNAAVKAAILAEAQANLAGALTSAQAKVTADNTAIAAVPGLNAAITAVADTTKAAAAALTADNAAHTAVNVAFAAYNAQNTTQLTNPTSGVYADQVAAVTALIAQNSTTGALSLKSGVTETTNPGVTALLNALVAEKAADTALTGANTAKTSAQATLDYLDGTPAYVSALKAVGAGMTLNKIPAGTLPTQGQIDAELAGLLAVKTAADAGSDAAAKTAAANAYNTFKGLSDAFAAADGTNTLSVKLSQDTTAVGTASDAVKGLSDALGALATANSLKVQLDAVNAQVLAATNAFSTKGLMAPVMLDANTTAAATFGADIFVAGTKNATVSSFDMNGIDSLYIGSKFTTLNTDLTKGNDAAIEAFVTKDGSGNVVISLETKAFASSEATTADLVQITLTGVTDVTKVHLNNGIITVS